MPATRPAFSTRRNGISRPIALLRGHGSRNAVRPSPSTEASVSTDALRDEAFVVYAANAADDGHVRYCGSSGTGAARPSPRARCAGCAYPGRGRCGVDSASRRPRDHQDPEHVYRPLAEFPVLCELVLLSRQNEPSPAVRRFIEIARDSGGSVVRGTVALQEPRRPKRRRQ